MNKKFYTLIHGGDVALAPAKKVLPAESFSEVLSGKEVLERVKNDAEMYRQEVVQECEALKEQAGREGFEEGFKKWTEKLAELEAEINSVKEELKKLVVPIALKAAKKIVGEQLSVSEETIINIVRNCLKGVAQHKKITIYVNKEELPILEQHRTQITELFEDMESLSLRPNEEIQKGGCVIETEGGIINAQIENRWDILEKAFANFTVQDVPTPEKEET